MTRSMTIPELLTDGLSRRFGQSDRILLDHVGQFASRADEAADFDAALLAIDHVLREQRAAVDLMVEPHICDAIEEKLRADRRVKHSNYSDNNRGAA